MVMFCFEQDGQQALLESPAAVLRFLYDVFVVGATRGAIRDREDIEGNCAL